MSISLVLPTLRLKAKRLHELLIIRNLFRTILHCPFLHTIPSGDLMQKRFRLDILYGAVGGIAHRRTMCGYGRSSVGADRTGLDGSFVLESCSLFAQWQKVKARRSSNKEDGGIIGLHPAVCQTKIVTKRMCRQPEDAQSRPGVQLNHSSAPDRLYPSPSRLTPHLRPPQVGAGVWPTACSPLSAPLARHRSVAVQQ
jgi:hypothetical protein